MSRIALLDVVRDSELYGESRLERQRREEEEAQGPVRILRLRKAPPEKEKSEKSGEKP